MGKRQRDCVGCGAPVGMVARQHCCRCTRRLREAAAKQLCPGCGKDRVLSPATGRCVLCSRRCSRCGHPVRAADATLCRDCRRRDTAQAAKATCPRCGRPGLLREQTGWCGSCSQPAAPRQPPRVCTACGQLRRHAGLGMCSPCWQRHPDRPFIRAQGIKTRLVDSPAWFDEFIGYLAVRHCPARACVFISALGRLLEDAEPNHPQALLERARRPGRSMGTPARSLEDFFTGRRLALRTDQEDRLAAGRRQRRVDAAPAELRPAIAAFTESMLRCRERARRAGTRPRSDHTVETAVAIIRDMARFLAAERNRRDWAVVDVHDIEAFLGALPLARKRRLTVLRQFFRFARAQRIVLVDPTRGLSASPYRGFTGQTLDLARQRALFIRWTTDPAVHPHEALLGILALLHAASSHEIRLLRCADVEPTTRTVRLGRRPQPVPLDPASWAVLQRCLQHRTLQHTDNPHVVVTRGTKAGNKPASTAYFTHALDAVGVRPRTVRGTRLIDLVNTMDPKLVADAFGMHATGVLIYLRDYVEESRLEAAAPNP